MRRYHGFLESGNLYRFYEDGPGQLREHHGTLWSIKYDFFQPDTKLSRQINTGFNRKGGVFRKGFRVGQRDRRRLVDRETNPVSDTMHKGFTEAGIANHTACRLIHSAGFNPRLGNRLRCLYRLLDYCMHPLELRGRLA